MGHKIGLVTWIGGPNYGTVLQSFALCSYLRQLGHDVTVIRKYDFVWGVKKSLDHVLRPLGIRILKQMDPDNLKFRRIRALQAETFKYHRVVGPFGKRAARRRFDVFVCGSDQIWNTYNCFDPFLFLDFAGSARRVAYAASIGTADVREDCRAGVAALVGAFDPVSLRERASVPVVSALTGRGDIRHVLDPTFLFDAAWWREFGAKAVLPSGLPEKYVLCYVLRRRDDLAAKMAEVCSRVGVDNVVLIPSGEFPDASVPGAVVCSDAGAREFVDLIRRAAFVYTDSFHGCAFSLNLGRPFEAAKRFDDDDPASQNLRIKDLLESGEALEAVRAESRKFLADALK